MKRIVLIGILLSIGFAQFGCNTLRFGGAPDRSFDAAADLKELEQTFKVSTAVTAYYGLPASATPEEKVKVRNQFIVGRLIIMNLHYLQFVRQTTQERQVVDAASDILVLSLNLAGAALRPETTKTVLAVASAAVAGTKIVIDKEFYFDKTMPALLAAMNAQRKAVMVRILQGRNQPIEEYSFEQAMSDLEDYYYAGTFYGAIAAIQADAGAKDAAQQEQIKEIPLLSDQDIVTRRQVTKAIAGITESAANFDKVKQVLSALNYTSPAGGFTTFAQAKSALQKYHRDSPGKLSEIKAALEGSGFTIPN